MIANLRDASIVDKCEKSFREVSPEAESCNKKGERCINKTHFYIKRADEFKMSLGE